MKKLSLAALLVAGLTAISCSSTLSEDSPAPSEQTVDLSFSIQSEGFQTDLHPMTRSDAKSSLGILDLALYTQSNNVYTFYKKVHSSYKDSDFGTLSIPKVALGNYYVVCLGSTTDDCDSVVWNNYHQIYYAAKKVPRCFAAVQQIAVTDSVQNSYSLNLTPAMAVLTLKVKSALPTSVKSLEFKFKNLSYTLNAETGLAGTLISNESDTWTCSVSVPDNWHGVANKSFSVQMFLSEADMSESSTAQVTVSALGENSTVIRSYDFDQVPLKKGYVTTYTGNFFDSTPQFTVTVDANLGLLKEVSY